MTKHIGTMIAWIVAAGLLLYVAQHYNDLLNAFIYLTKGGDGKGLFQYVDALFK